MRAGLTPWNTIESGAARTLTIRRPTADRVSRRRAASTSGSSGIALVYPRPRRGAGDARPPHVIRFGPIWGRVPENPREELSMARMTGGEAIVKALAREGVKVAFGLPGVQLYGIVTAFRDEPIRFITVRHEGSSTYMADGYARAGGDVGVAVAVPGPGLLNAAAGLNTAYSASSPVLLIAGQIPRHQIGKDRKSTRLNSSHDQISYAV